MGPTLAQTAAALRTALADALSGSGVQIVPEGADFKPNGSGIYVLQAFRPTDAEAVELSGRAGLGRRHGLYLLAVSVPFGVPALTAQAMAAVETLADAFRHRAFVTSGNGGTVFTDEPALLWGGVRAKAGPGGGVQSEVAGKDEAGRTTYTVSVPWTTWTGGDA